MKIRTQWLVVACLMSMVGCATPETSEDASSASIASSVHSPADRSTVYSELGGATGVDKLTQEFIRELAGNERMKARFKESDISRFDEKIQEHLCMLSGGGCEYTGDSMVDVHGGMNVSPAEFNLLVEALMRAMDTRDISAGTQNRLLHILAPLRSRVIGL